MRQSNKSLGMKISAFVLAFAMVLTLVGTANVSALAADDDSSAVETVSVNRAYNPNNGEHLLTVDKAEYDYNVGLGLNAEGEKWLAPVKSNTPLYRVYNPNSGEHLLIADKGEYDSVVASGWNGEDLKMYSDDNKGVAIYRVFNPNATDAGSHLYAEKEEADYLVSIGWNLENNGQPVIYGVAAKYSSDVELIDLNGFQTDGSAMLGDTLQIRFGSDLGVPSNVVWYKDGAVVKAIKSDIDSDAMQLVTNTTGAGIGVYYAQVETTDGKVHKTQSVSVVEDGVASITNVSVADYTDEYGDGWYQTFSSVDTSAVITFDVNKVYDDDIIVFAEVSKLADKDYKSAVKAAYSIKALTTEATSGKQIKVQSKQTDKAALDNCKTTASVKASYYKHDDGHYTVKLPVREAGVASQLGSAGLQRGDTYMVLVTDQKTLLSAAVGTAVDPTTVTITGQTFTIPYLPAPKAIALAASQQGNSGSGVLTYYLDEEKTTPVPFFGTSSKTVSAVAVGASAEPTVRVAKSSDGSGATDATPTSEGIAQGKQSQWIVNDITDYVGLLGSVTFKKGIYGDSEFTLKSEIAPFAATPVTSMVPSYDAISAPNDIDVTVTGLMTKGTAILYRIEGTNSAAQIAAIKAGQATPVGAKSLSKGAASVKFDGVVDSLHDKTYDLYMVGFIPDNTEDFAVYANEKQPGTVTAQASTFKCTQSSVTTAGGITGSVVKLTAIDQFNKEMSEDSFTPATLNITSAKATLVPNSAASTDAELKVSVVTEGKVQVTVENNEATVDSRDYYTLKLNTKQSLKFTPVAATANTGASTVQFTVSIIDN